MVGLDERIAPFERPTTIRIELENNIRYMMLRKHSQPSKYSVIFSKITDNISDSRSYDISETDFLYLYEKGVRK